MSRELLRLTKEAAYGVYDTTPDAADVITIDIQEDNGWTVRENPEFWDIRSAASNNQIVKTGSDISNVAGDLKLYMRGSYSKFLIDLATLLSGSNCKDLGSFTADYGTFTEDGTCTAAFTRYLGCKFSSMKLSCDNTNQGQLLKGAFGVTAKKSVPITLTDFPIPAASDYDNDKPFSLRDTDGAILLDAVARDPESLEISVENVLNSYRGNSRWISWLRANGRTSNVMLRGLYLSNADRVAYQGIEAKSLAITFTNDTHVMAWDFGDANLIKAIADDFKMSDFNRQALTIQNFLDGPGGTDFTVAVTEVTP
jgi:hypothetical protein